MKWVNVFLKKRLSYTDKSHTKNRNSDSALLEVPTLRKKLFGDIEDGATVFNDVFLGDCL